MMVAYQEIAELAEQLPKADKARLIKHLSGLLRHEIELESPSEMSWHEFLNATYGILADDPIQRWDQGEYEEREPLE